MSFIPLESQVSISRVKWKKQFLAKLLYLALGPFQFFHIKHSNQAAFLDFKMPITSTLCVRMSRNLASSA